MSDQPTADTGGILAIGDWRLGADVHYHLVIHFFIRN